MACINHLFALRNDKTAATALLQGLVADIKTAELVCVNDEGENAGYVEFESVGGGNYLNEASKTGKLTRGANSTSIDALMKGKISGKSRENLCFS